MLREAIARGDMVPGQRLVEGELAEQLDVTRASARAALIDLTGEGLVERIPNRGARVRIVSTDEAVAITECRMVLEALCAAKAAERVTDAEIAEFHEVGIRLRHAVADGEPLAYAAQDQELYRLVRARARQHVAAELLDRLRGQVVRHQFRLALDAEQRQASLPRQLAIVDAIAARDPAAADAAVRAQQGGVIDALRAAAPEGEGVTS